MELPSIEEETARLFPKLREFSARNIRNLRAPVARTKPKRVALPSIQSHQGQEGVEQNNGPEPKQVPLPSADCDDHIRPRVVHARDVRRTVAQSARKMRQSARKNATGVSYYTDEPGHGKDVMPGQFLDYHLPRSRVPGFGSIYPDADDKAWLATIFPTHLPASREDVMRLRQWLQSSIADLEEEGVRENVDMLKLAQQGISLYNLGFHEITRQVSLHCVERGRLMADIWTSNLDMMGRVLQEMRCQKERSDAAATALRRRNQVLERQMEGVEQLLMEKRAQLKAATDKMAELQRAALGHAYTTTRSVKQ